MKTPAFSPRRAWSMASKEFAHVLRDKFTMAIALGLPLIFVFVFGVAIESNVKNIPTAVIDQDHSQSSRQLIESFSGSSFFLIKPLLQMSEVQRYLESEKVKAAIIIPPNFERDLLSGKGADVQVLANSADSQAGTSVVSYVGQIQPRAVYKIMGLTSEATVELKSRYLFNPELNSRWFYVPGLMVIILAMIAVLLTALTIAREWEFGSMELLLSTPVRPLEIIVGKIIPYAVLCLIAMVITYVCARLFFGVPFRGNLPAYTVACIVFLATYLAQGLLVSFLTRKQMLAMQMAMMIGMMPSMLLSGFIYPLENMPKVLQYITYVFPARWFMEISRACFLNDASFWEMKNSFAMLVISMVAFIVLSLLSFKKDLEP